MSERELLVEQKKPRRWYQFGLRTMFGVTTVCAMLMTIVVVTVVVPGERQRATVKAIYDAGGWVAYEDMPEEPGWWYRTRHEWFPQDYVDEVVDVYLRLAKSPGEEILRQVVKLTQLKRLNLTGSHITDAGLAQLAHFKKLEVLLLNQTQVTDAGLAQLAALTKLTVLHLDETQITDAGLAHLAGLSELQIVGLTGTKVTERGVAELQKSLPKCHIYWRRASGSTNTLLGLAPGPVRIGVTGRSKRGRNGTAGALGWWEQCAATTFGVGDRCAIANRWCAARPTG